MNESEIRDRLRSWILERVEKPPDGGLSDDAPILEAGLLSSLQVVELILYIESLRGEEVELDLLKPQALTNLDTLYATFFQP